jgi:hypothetical protein
MRLPVIRSLRLGTLDPVPAFPPALVNAGLGPAAPWPRAPGPADSELPVLAPGGRRQVPVAQPATGAAVC